MRSIGLIVLTIVGVSAYAEGNGLAHLNNGEAWQFIGGRGIPLVLPNRPVGKPENYRKLIEAPQEDREFSFQGKRPRITRNRCPAVTALFETVYDRIVEANSLDPFVVSGPGMKLFVSCKEPIFPTFGKTTKYNGVVIGDIVLDYLDTEDALAFIIAHEIAHVLLGHTELMWDFEDLAKELGSNSRKYKNLVARAVQGQEAAADQMAPALARNAGYNPYGGISLLSALADASETKVSFFQPLLEWFWDDGHGSTSERIRRVRQAADAIVDIQKDLSTKSVLFLAAKAEFKKQHTVARPRW